ncbi:NAD-glutamate dehydrogenase [Rhizobium sp. Leaf371]|uniref:NAD-glutamate dehydrogenase n=1 Tax=Rhizobium sp. Leaf371 TaxID=1736355 RepID=UPI0007127FE7|nr:NAD-glutamate dehydrogenase [Rhizobium sp. Leaf371]KQS71997.1 NAD-glutamate dehydrogenase [Rhizobium sp. Leaf371]
MGTRHHPKKTRLIGDIEQAAERLGQPFLSPAILFGRASPDDIAAYDIGMLASAAVHAYREIKARRKDTSRVTVTDLESVRPGGAAISVLCVTDRNMPFLYDSVMGEVTSRHRDLSLAVHPILVVSKGSEPVLFDPEEESDPADRVSHIQIHLSHLSPDEAKALVGAVETVLAQVHQAVGDWEPMKTLLGEAMGELERHAANKREADRDEALAFLKWLRDDNFTFLGMREYSYSGDGQKATLDRGTGHGLGILSDPNVRVLRQGLDAVVTTPEILAFLQGPDFLIVTKANTKAVVHRRAYMDYIGIKRFDAKGNVIGELRVVGLFTSTAYTRSASDIPLLRLKVRRVIEHFGFDPHGHSGKMLINTLESYPRDDLFQIDVEELQAFCEQINELADRPRVRVLPRIDRFDRFVSIIVYVPREQYDSRVRERIGDLFKDLYEGRVSAYYPAFPAGGLARVHFIIGRSGGTTPRIAQSTLEDAVREIVTRWADRFHLLARRDGVALSVTEGYQAAFAPAEAYADLPDIAAVRTDDPIRIAFYERHRPQLAQDAEPDTTEAETADRLELKIFHADHAVSLSQRVPLLENLGFRVVSEQTHDISISDGNGERLVVLHDMELIHRDGKTLDVSSMGPLLEEAFLSAWTGKIEDDAFNRLILLSGLNARDVTVLRAYARYLRQAGIPYSQGLIAETLNKYPQVSADIFHLFIARMDPKTEETARSREVSALQASLEDALNAVPSLDEDRILRRMMNAVLSTLRTNYFQRDEAGEPRVMLAFKFDPKLLDGLPEPRPFREIFVYGVEVEGVHLRFGKVARGGLRWSDRAQDYRTEVLGLVKAQQVKNAVIVPVGAKGGFFPKLLPAGGARDEIFRVGTEAYKTYIRTMLSITDNIVDQQIVPPNDTLRLDGDDPYFVVAADKGTATFSDTANGLAQDAGFWLDDAFASGGSAGYDHKKMGITARGAWETVKRHFREMNIDIQTTPFSVVGVGDMSGDVFGNGMLLSRQIRLIGAFDHRDIIIDPDPDIAASFAERERLFALPRSSWQDYDRSALSTGGMIIPRTEKSVKLTPEAAAAIGLEKTQATPFEIMTAILKARVDLLWFGGIGTYVRGPTETDADVGDRANDPIRITADEVGARVIGEGANLGVTQRGRIAFGLAGGRCNSDAIDNSAGVNSSDVEVNIKIALASAMRDGRLTRAKRNTLLASMTDEVASLVLHNNYQQSLAISLTEMQGAANRTSLARLMTRLETEGLLNRKVEVLPNDSALSERYQSGKALTRAEIGVLLSYAKIVLFDEIVDSDLPDDPYFHETLIGYFPGRMQKAHQGDIETHRLRREIIATLLCNDVINRGGPAFVSTMIDQTGFLPADVVKAAVLTRDGYDLPRLYKAIDALDNKVPGSVQNELYQDVGRIFAIVTERTLRTRATTGPLGQAIDRLRKALENLKTAAHGAVPEEAGTEIEARAASLIEKGVPEALARDISQLFLITLVPEIMQISAVAGTSLGRTAQSYFAVTQSLKVGRLLAAAERIITTDPYEAMALARSTSDIADARRAITIAALTQRKGEKQPVLAWQEGAADRFNRVVTQLTQMTEKGETTLAKITVAAGLLSDLAEDRAG